MLDKLMQEECKYDLCMPSDYAVEMLIAGGWLAELDHSNIPNERNIDEAYLDLPFDPGNRYSLPYTWGVLGVLFNRTMVDEADTGSWDILWNEKYSGSIYMYDSLRDTMAVALGYCGYSMNTKDPGEIREAGDALVAQSALVKGWGTDDNKDAMVEGKGAVAVLFNGDAVWCNDPVTGNSDLDFYVPDGSNIFLDNFIIPKNAANKKNAEKFINFLLEPANSAKNTEQIGYSTPNRAALELIDDDLKNDPIFSIPESKREKLEFQRDIGDAITLYEEQWGRLFDQ